VLLDDRGIPTFDVLGPTVRFLATADGHDGAPCILRGAIPPGVAIPLHSHPDPETFLARSGELEGLAPVDGALAWVRIRPGDIFHVPAGTRHAFRNRSPESAVAIIVTTARLGRFLREVGTRIEPGQPGSWPPTKEAARRLLATAERYGHWNATPAENAQHGLQLG
jgi:uncharacterized RmlC-like cupin family protein